MTARQALLAALAAGLLVAAAFHAVAAVVPHVAPSSTPLRHAVFVLVNVAAAVGLVWRPRGVVPLFALLCVQQLASHGAEAFRVYRDAKRIDVASVVVIVALPVALALLVAETRGRRRPERARAS